MIAVVLELTDGKAIIKIISGVLTDGQAEKIARQTAFDFPQVTQWILRDNAGRGGKRCVWKRQQPESNFLEIMELSKQFTLRNGS